MLCLPKLFSCFFQAEDGIRDYKVTGVQTCALPILLIVDGLRFPAERFLADLQRNLWELGPRPPKVAGGLASQQEFVPRVRGARVFFQERIYPAACLAIAFHGVAMRIEVVRGWSPASPVFT